jgi:hypothetical protein
MFTIIRSKNKTPNKQMVNDKAKPYSHTKSPSVQNLRKFGINLDQLKPSAFEKAPDVGANTRKYK